MDGQAEIGPRHESPHQGEVILPLEQRLGEKATNLGLKAIEYRQRLTAFRSQIVDPDGRVLRKASDEERKSYLDLNYRLEILNELARGRPVARDQILREHTEREQRYVGTRSPLAWDEERSTLFEANLTGFDEAALNNAFGVIKSYVERDGEGLKGGKGLS